MGCSNCKAINSWKDLEEAFPMYRDEMSIEEEGKFVDHCFDLYEKEGFAKTFWSSGGDFPELIGKPFAVVRRVTEKEINIRCLPMWKIQFKGGKRISAYPDEIILREMRESGFKGEAL